MLPLASAQDHRQLRAEQLRGRAWGMSERVLNALVAGLSPGWEGLQLDRFS